MRIFRQVKLNYDKEQFVVKKNKINCHHLVFVASSTKMEMHNL